MQFGNRVGKTLAFFLISMGLLMGCGGGGGGSDSGPVEAAAVDLAGTWDEEEVVTGNCSGESYPITENNVLTISQNNNVVVIRNELENEETEGVLSGRTLTFNTSRPDQGGTMSISFTGTCSENGEHFEGTATWTWSDSEYSCNGTTQVTADKLPPAVINATGNWNGQWQSNENNVSGDFSATIVDTEGELSGTITIPQIGMTNSELTGTVDGSAITFGDINGAITFTGVIDDSMTASGSYTYDSLGDAGTWTGSAVPQ